MSFSKQPAFGSKVFADEVSSADYEKLCNLSVFLMKFTNLVERDVVGVRLIIPVNEGIIVLYVWKKNG
jgi:hypothetical protein